MNKRRRTKGQCDAQDPASPEPSMAESGNAANDGAAGGRITSIEIEFPVGVEMTRDEEKALVTIAGSICDRYQEANPGRVMWPFGIGQRMLSNPFLLGDAEPLEFDETCFEISCSERADYKWPCAKCGLTQGDHKGHITDPPAGHCEFEPAPYL